MTATETAPATKPAAQIVWTRNATTGQYTSTCGRFTVSYDRVYSNHGRWVVADRARPDGEYHATICRKYTLASGKGQCERWLRGYAV